jgi:hypothetical protein
MFFHLEFTLLGHCLESGRRAQVLGRVILFSLSLQATFTYLISHAIEVGVGSNDHMRSCAVETAFGFTSVLITGSIVRLMLRKAFFIGSTIV